MDFGNDWVSEVFKEKINNLLRGMYGNKVT
jgi:hypothetical protein